MHSAIQRIGHSELKMHNGLNIIFKVFPAETRFSLINDAVEITRYVLVPLFYSNCTIR